MHTTFKKHTSISDETHFLTLGSSSRVRVHNVFSGVGVGVASQEGQTDISLQRKRD